MLVQFKHLTFSLALVSFPIAGVQAQTPHDKKATAVGHVMIIPTDIKWSDGPPSLPAGAKMSVFAGDLAKKGPFTVRFQLPANYRIPAHWHPADEHVTVISGTFHMGLGDKLDTAEARALPPGGFALMAKGTRHFAWASTESIIQLHGIGPWGITYVNPADDPRKKSSR
jgi:quercetin dioxygenase-like cupin family protein